MSWILDGKKVRAEYLGIAVVGTVTDSRVKYGGKVQYQVKADPFWVHSLQSYREVVLVDEDDVLVDFGVLSEVE